METRQDGASAAGQREWSLVWREGVFRVRPEFPLTMGGSAWPFADGEYVRLREVAQESQPSTAPAAQGEALAFTEPDPKYSVYSHASSRGVICAVSDNGDIFIRPDASADELRGALLAVLSDEGIPLPEPPAASQGMREADLEAVRSHLYAAREKMNVDHPGWDQVVDACRALDRHARAALSHSQEAPAKEGGGRG